MQKQILVAVTGGIAAYKSVELVRLLMGQGHSVRVVMTRGAEAFVTPLTFQAISGQPVHTQLLDPEAEAGMGHIELARWAHCIIVAPASAQVMAKLAAGMADDLLGTLCLASEAPICLVPAMNQAMWRNARTQANAQRLAADPQFHLWGPAEGVQACGDTGPGRMLEPAAIVAALNALEAEAPASQQTAPKPASAPTSAATGPLAGLRVLITAGPTREAVDPVRYISNHSSGKMGFALAAAAASLGAHVTLVAGPVNLATPAGVRRRDVITAEAMQEAVMQALEQGCDWFVAAAAVADYRPVAVAGEKLKKDQDAEMVLQLTRNPDILAGVAALMPRPLVVGFAAETRQVAEYARDKLARKKLDLIVANDVSDERIGFNSDQNAVQVFWPGGEQPFASQAKTELAQALCHLFHEHWQRLGKPSR
ncbi:MAG: bifunctional phosphopantothenoylcysteine decarboxylase/phosphopantothenate--cysteine ligase CoaBC [Halomonadaceae bacterium]|nr:MAG: bifunctional phosphopantothenoylcysteine decarboxylase/phosphopantothenate--cysteine ligase CoaBC [Halomonadaceae bacterium]